MGELALCEETVVWRGAEVLEAESPEDWTGEAFLPALAHRTPQVAAAFGEPRPPSHRMLLHRGPEPMGRPLPNPVLLVPGLGQDAVRGFGGAKGLVARLAAAGFRVHGVTGAHPQGSLRPQARALSLALAQVSDEAGAAVDLVGHSRGALVALAVAGGLDAPPPGPERLRRLVLLGAPLGGTDFIFRHPSWALLAAGWDEPYPYPDGLGISRARTVRGGSYAGQLEILHPWCWKVPVGDPMAWWNYAGLGWAGAGLEAARRAGGNLLGELRARPLPAHVEVAVLAGNVPYLPPVRAGLPTGGLLLGTWEAPSDGFLLVESALDVAPFLADGARLLRREVVPLNHYQLRQGAVAGWLTEVLTGSP